MRCWERFVGGLFSEGVFGKFSESVSGERFFGKRVGSSCLESYFGELFSGGDLRKVCWQRVWGAIFGRRFEGGSLGVLFVDLLWNIFLTDRR